MKFHSIMKLVNTLEMDDDVEIDRIQWRDGEWWSTRLFSKARALDILTRGVSAVNIMPGIYRFDIRGGLNLVALRILCLVLQSQSPEKRFI